MRQSSDAHVLHSENIWRSGRCSSSRVELIEQIDVVVRNQDAYTQTSDDKEDAEAPVDGPNNCYVGICNTLAARRLTYLKASFKFLLGY